jgi:membrane associated rhomboid family serine protease
MTPAPVGLRCPEHSGAPQGVQKVTRAVTGSASVRPNIVTLALIVANCAVAVVEFAVARNASFTNNTIFDHGALFASACCINGQVVGVAHGDWWRLGTSMFLHASFIHIALNMFSLYWVGSILEQVIGHWRFLLLYLVSGIAGSAGALLWSPNVPTVGASGAIFGLLGALLILELRGRISTGGQIAGLIVINLVFTFALSSSISVGGHLGGLVAGGILMMLMLTYRRSAVLSVVSSIAVAAVSVVIAYLKVRNYQ